MNGIKKYGDVKFADKKGKKYPINTKEHADAAARYIGMPKNRKEYSKSEGDTIAARIRKAVEKFAK
jgi:hypothetical protein